MITPSAATGACIERKARFDLKKLKKYRCKNKNEKLFLQYQEICACFITKELLQECYHRMSSQKNKAMNKSIMRFAPKDKTYARMMSLTSRINLAIGIDCVGHGKYCEILFLNMRFHPTELTFSGLRWMWCKKEYGRIYTGLWRVKKRRPLAARTKMMDGVA